MEGVLQMAVMQEKMDLENPEVTFSTKKPGLCGSQRLTLALLGFFMFFQLYAQRIAMSVAIVCMVNQTAVTQDALTLAGLHGGGGNDSGVVEAPHLKCGRVEDNSTEDAMDGPFNWSKNIQGQILGSFFYGYVVSQIPGGLLAQQFGGKWVLGGSVTLFTIATLITPLAARIHVGFLIFVRVICGIGSGALFPAMHTMWGVWAPPLERTTLCGISYAGSMMGNVIALPMSGLLCKYGFSERWDSIFYVIGLSSIIILVLWCFLTSNSPDSHPRISERERNYITEELRKEGASQSTDLSTVPWKSFFKSKAVWALIFANFTTDWGLYTYLTNIPTFYKEVLFFDISSNGFFSALPFLGLWAVMNFVPMLADKLQSSRVLTTIATRKMFNTLGLIGPAILLIALSFVDCTQTAVAVTLLVAAVSVSGFVFSGYLVNHMDIAPQYAGALMGLANGIAACSGFIAPNVAAAITVDHSRESWQKVFFIAAGVYFIGALLFLFLASAEIQPWARREKDSVEMVVNGDGPKKGGDVEKPMLEQKY